MKYKESMFNIEFMHNEKSYAYNTRTNTLAEFEHGINICLKEGKYINEMKSCGFIVEDNIDEMEKLERAVTKFSNEIPKRLDITVVLTEDCNFRCVYCYQDKGHKLFSAEDADKLVDYLEKVFESEVEGILIHYFGGEPLLNLSILKYLDIKLKNLCREKGKSFESYITTNGSLLVPETLKQLQFNTIQLTFDGDEKTHPLLKRAFHADYKTLLNTVKMVLSNSDSNLNIRFNICEENKDCFDKVLEDIFKIPEFDVDRVRFSFSPLRNHTNCKGFTEMKPNEYAKIDYELRRKLLLSGKKLFLPRAMAQPCKFTVGNAVCIGPDLKSYFCTTDFDKDGKCQVNDFCNMRSNIFKLPNACKCCNVAPLCLCSCKLLDPERNACVTEKYKLIDLLKLYLDNPDMWIA